ncbi:MAG: hypothetical protein KC900_06235 [Candidatus Omnitrophica bacterium]|nr:hypothetical protein [Candidatus Omnitrophota bacterium]
MRTAPKILFITLVLHLVLPVLVPCLSAVPGYAQEVPGQDPSFRDVKTEEGFTLDLKQLIERSKKKIEQVDDKLKDQARDRRNQQREAKAREYFDKATTLYERGDLDQARELWEKAIKITEHEEMEDYINLSVRRQRVQEKALRKAEKRRLKRLEKERGYTAKEVNKKYREAVKFYRDEKYLAAKVAFEEVDEMFPDHKATRSYIALINDRIESDQQKMIEDKLKNKTFSSAKSKARWKKELEEEEKARQKELRRRADSLYEEAVQLYKDKQFKVAKEKFKEVEWMLPDYKNTIKYLARIDGDIKKHGVTFTEEDKVKYFKEEYKRIRDRDDWAAQNKVDPKLVRESADEERRREEAAFVYDAALTLYKKDYHKQALEKFYEVQALYPDYKKTQSYIRKLHKKVPGSENDFTRMREQARKSAAPLFKPAPGVNEQVIRAIDDEQRKRIDQAEGKYKQALAFYQEHNLTEAQRKFIEVESIYPGYKATRDYLSHIDGDIARQHAEKKDNKNGVGGIFSFLSGGGDDTHRDKYRQAKELYAQEKYQEAMDLFEEVQHMKPGYRGTEKYLARIARKLAEPPKVAAKTKDVDSDEDADPGRRNIAKKVEPIPGMTSGVPKNYPEESADSHEQTEAENHKDMVAFTKPVTSMDDTGPVKPLTEMERKKLATNSKELKKLRAKAERDGVLTEGERKSLLSNRKDIDKELSRQQKESARRMADVVEETYKEAVGLYKLEQYAGAKAKFATVEGIKPGYKRAAEYMRKADEWLNEKYQPLPDEPVTATRKQPPAPAAELVVAEAKAAPVEEAAPRKKSLEELAAEIDDDYYHPMSDIEYSRRTMESAQLTGEETRKAREARLQRLADAEMKEGEVMASIAEMTDEELREKYRLGKNLYHAKNYRKAKTVFAQISERQADYKGTQRYLRKIDIILDRQKVQREEYRHKMAQHDEKDAPGAESPAVAAAVPSPEPSGEKAITNRTEEYFAAAARKADRRNGLKPPASLTGGAVGMAPDVDQTPPEYAVQLVKDLYDEGKKFYGQKDYPEAHSFFARVEQMHPDYKRTRRYLKKIQSLVSVSGPQDSGAGELPAASQKKPTSPPPVPSDKGKADAKDAADYRKLVKEQREAEEQNKKLARLDRRARAEQEELASNRDANIYREMLEAQRADQKRLQTEQGNARQEKELRAQEEEKRRKREERQAKEELLAKIKNDLRETRQQALDLLAANEESKAQLQINKFDQLLTHSGFSAREQRRWERDFEKRRKRILKRLEKERVKEENSILAKTNLSREEKDKLTIKQQRELEKIEERIQTEQRKLAQAREEEKKRLQKLAQAQQSTDSAAEKIKPSADRTSAINKALDNVNIAKVKASDLETLAELEEKKKREIEELVKERQKELQSKRKKVQQEFDKSLSQMYKKGVRLYKKKIYDESANIFQEIQRMRPGYKKVAHYLSKIDEELIEQKTQQFRAQRRFQTPNLATSGAQVAGPVPPTGKKENRLQSIKNALDDFEEKMW